MVFVIDTCNRQGKSWPTKKFAMLQEVSSAGKSLRDFERERKMRNYRNPFQRINHACGNH
jgi:hypothetical protein